MVNYFLIVGSAVFLVFSFCLVAHNIELQISYFLFRYPHWIKRLPVISAYPMKSAAPLNTALIKTVTIFY